MPERALRHEESPFDQWQKAPRARSPIRPKGLSEDLGVTALSSRRGLRAQLFEAHRDCAHRREVVGASAEGRLRARNWKALHFSVDSSLSQRTQRREASATPGQSASRRFVARGTETHLAGRSDWQWRKQSHGPKGTRDLEPAPPELFDRTGFPAVVSHFGYCSPLLRGPLARAKLLEGQNAPKSSSQERFARSNCPHSDGSKRSLARKSRIERT